MSAYRVALERLLALKRFGVRPGLDGVRAALAAVGDPQRGLACVHIAGTNGKGSTAAFTAALLAAAGRRVGLYTSPHLARFTERIRIDGRELDEDEVARRTAQVLDAAPEVTFFEAATAVALAAFAAHGVEVAVIEAGLGGRLDSTNVVQPVVTVVTGVALDHVEVLGPTLADIAREKGGICKAGVPAVLACRDEVARAVLLESAARAGARAWLLGRDLHAAVHTNPPLALDYRGPGGPLLVEELGLVGAHQADNAALALAAVALGPPAWQVPDAARARALAATRWPGRLERLAHDLWVDAAHNPDGARALAAALPAIAVGRPIVLLLGVVDDKDAAGIAAPLLPLAARVVVTRPPSPRGLDADRLAALVPGAEVAGDVDDALARARGGGALVVACGSTFLVGAVRARLLGEPVDPIVAQDPPAKKL